MVKEFNHIGVNVRDLQKTLAFYSEHLGAKFPATVLPVGIRTI